MTAEKGRQPAHAVSAPSAEEVSSGKIASVQTFMEQTRLLVTLSSAFLVAPVGILGLLKDRANSGLTTREVIGFVGAESCFVLSVFAGYVVMGTIAGWQAKGLFDVFRRATRNTSFAQIGLYIAGMVIFIGLALTIANAPPGKTEYPKPTLIRIVP